MKVKCTKCDYIYDYNVKAFINCPKCKCVNFDIDDNEYKREKEERNKFLSSLRSIINE